MATYKPTYEELEIRVKTLELIVALSLSDTDDNGQGLALLEAYQLFYKLMLNQDNYHEIATYHRDKIDNLLWRMENNDRVN